jgi:putative transposase
MSYVRVWIHTVFATKYRHPMIHNSQRNDLFSHIKENARSKNIMIDSVNGYLDHAHILFLLNRDMSISKALQLIKGESSHWVNALKLSPEKFIWQDDYWAVSVGENDVFRVRRYIANQVEHHRKKSFMEEIEELGFEKFKDEKNPFTEEDGNNTKDEKNPFTEVNGNST